MSDLPSYPELLGDARLAAHASSSMPAWLWSTDGTRILWANPVGAAMFGAATAAAIAARTFDARQGVAAQMLQLSGALPYGGGARLQRLRGLGAFGGPLLCSCARVVVSTHIPAVLVIALEPAGPKLPLPERARRLVDAVAGPDGAAAAFAPHGELLCATTSANLTVGTAAMRRLGAQIVERGDLAAPEPGVSLARLGEGPDIVWMATFAAAQTPVATRPADSLPLESIAPSAPLAPTETSSVADPRSEIQANDNPADDATPQRDDTDVEALRPDDAAREDLVEAISESEPVPSDEARAGSDSAATPDATESAAAHAHEDAASADALVIERRHPLRFVWQMDGDGRFTLGSEEFTDVIGPHMAAALGRPWAEVAGELGLDPDDQMARAVATRDTWSGITVSWPVDGSSDRLRVEMSGLPIFDRARVFLGYRGFGVCRDVDTINGLARQRRTGGADQPAPLPPHADAPAEQPASAPAETPPEPRKADERPALTLVPPAKNVVPFRTGTAEVRNPALSPVEHNAFRELARQLTARLRDNGEPADKDAPPATDGDSATAPPSPEPAAEPPAPVADAPVAEDAGEAHAPEPADVAEPDHRLLDRLPAGILIYRFDQLLYANRAFLDWSGHDDLEGFAEAGGLDGLLIDSDGGETDQGRGRTVMVASPDDTRKSPGSLFTLPWDGASALALVIDTASGAIRREADAIETARRAEAEVRELAFVVEAASDAVLVVDRAGRVLSANGRAQSLFGRETGALDGQSLFELFAPESQRIVRHQFDLLTRKDADTAVTDPREVAARVKTNGHVVLLMTLGRIGETGERFCVVLRDITAWKTQEHELVAARLQAERASRAKSDFLAKISHEIRTPLNSIIGFSDVMIEEKFGPIGNERYREYLKDIRNSGDYVVSLLNDLLDLSKIEAGKLELNFVAVNLNEMIHACVMLMQPQANREHIIIRTSLSSSVKPVLADAKAIRQIVLNLLSNSIKFTGAGGQVIVSTAALDGGGVAVRVRDTGIGMSESDLAAALEPFRQLASAARWGSSGTGLGLPLTKALIEANRAAFVITSKVNEGTLVEVTFPANRLVST